jgi:hypothetical protein
LISKNLPLSLFSKGNWRGYIDLVPNPSGEVPCR